MRSRRDDNLGDFYAVLGWMALGVVVAIVVAIVVSSSLGVKL